MKISVEWLRDFVSWDDSTQGLTDRLTAAGLNVEGVADFRIALPGVVVARVLHQERHPDADRLSVCRVDDGSGQSVPVVCGASNVRGGLTVLLARVGAVLPGDVKIKKSKIRGQTSEGMICSAAELGLGRDAAGIIELDTELPPGTPADELFGYHDTVLDIEVTPNRPDWLSHLGVAREIAAIYGGKVSLPATWNSQRSGESLGLQVRVEDFGDCPRYMACGVQGVKVGPSPAWMQRRLLAVGSRPINNLVDITNYVLFEMGQPLHAFDRGKISGSTITVRRAGEKVDVTTLDGVQRTVGPETLLICDQRAPVALAGVMGLANTEVGPSTTDVLLESAFFTPRLIRHASRGLGLLSESSYRFERGADWEMVERAAQRAAYLLQEHADGHDIKDWTDRQDPERKPHDAIPLRLWQVNRVLGTRISADEAAQLLQGLGLNVQPMGNAQSSSQNAVNMMVGVPSFRRDLDQEIDLIEEIARSYGLDRIEDISGFRPAEGSRRRPLDTALDSVRRWLVAEGFHEIVTSSFAGEQDLQRLDLPAGDPRLRTLAVNNPRHGGNTQLRTVLLPSLLEVMRRNLNAGARPPVRLFQVNRVYRPGTAMPEPGARPDQELLPGEPLIFQVGIAGSQAAGPDGIPADLLQIKGILGNLKSLLRLDLKLEVRDGEPWLQDGAQWVITDAQGRAVGAAGHVRPAVGERF